MKRKVLVWALVVLFLGSLTSTVWYFLEKERLFREKESLLRENAALSDRLLMAREENRQLNQRIEEMALEAERLSREYESLMERYDQALVEKDSLAIEVRGLNEVKIILSKKAEELELELARVKEDKAKIEEELKIALEKLKFEREVVEVGPGEVELREIVVRAKPEEAPSRREGRVIAVSDEHNFVVIDLGEADGVQRGMRFGVYRRDRRIGEVRVIELRRHLAAANVEAAKGRSKLKKDDVVRPEE